MKAVLTTLLCLLIGPYVLAKKSKASKESTEVAQATAPPPFFLTDPVDGLCLSGSTFARCDVTTLYYVSGNVGEYQIHRRLEEGERESCLGLKSCSASSDAINVKHTKCTHCSAKAWNILGDSTSGYVLSTMDGEKCLARDRKSQDGDTSVTVVDCTSLESITPLNLNFASKEDIRLMSSPGAQMVRRASEGDLKAIKKLLKDGVDVDEGDWDSMTALIAAAGKGHLSIVQHLIQKQNADVLKSDKDGIDAVISACVGGHLNVVKWLVEKGGGSLKGIEATGVSPLWLAAGEGKADVVKYLIGKDQDVNAVRIDGISPLTAAVINSHVPVVKLLLANGADPTIVDSDGVTALTNAAEVGNVEVVKLLVEDSDVNSISTTGYSALVVASAGGHAEIVKILLANGAQPNLLHTDDVTALMYGASTKQFEVVKALVEGGANPLLRHAQGGSAIIEAATGGELEIVRYLVEKGAPYNDEDTDGVSTLQSAAAQGNFEIVKYLCEIEKSKTGPEGLKKWVNKYSISGGTSIMFGAGGRNPELVEYLISVGANVNDLVKGHPTYLDKLAALIAEGKEAEDHKDDITALHVAAMGGDLAMTQLLLDNGADVLAVDEDGTSSLMGAVKGNFGDIATLLIKNGANPDDVYIDEEENPHNLLNDAIIVENSEFALLLIEHGASLSHMDSEGVTVLIQSAHRGMTDVVKALLDRKDEELNVNALNSEGISALIAASSEGHEEIVELLLRSGADVSAKDSDETNSLMAAAVRGHHELCRILLRVGADPNAQNTDGHTALMFAYNGKAQVETLWDRYGSSLSETESDFLLVKEALHNHTETVNVIAKVADLTIKDKEGHVAADFDYNPEVDEELVEQEKAAEKKRKRSKREL